MHRFSERFRLDCDDTDEWVLYFPTVWKWRSSRVDTLDKLRERLQELDSELSEPTAFRELYTFTFLYGKLSSQRNLDLETALAYWKILFKDKVIGYRTFTLFSWVLMQWSFKIVTVPAVVVMGAISVSRTWQGYFSWYMESSARFLPYDSTRSHKLWRRRRLARFDRSIRWIRTRETESSATRTSNDHVLGLLKWYPFFRESSL